MNKISNSLAIGFGAFSGVVSAYLTNRLLSEYERYQQQTRQQDIGRFHAYVVGIYDDVLLKGKLDRAMELESMGYSVQELRKIAVDDGNDDVVSYIDSQVLDQPESAPPDK